MRSPTLRVFCVFILLVGVLVVSPAQPALASCPAVLVTNLNDSGAGSLRAAISSDSLGCPINFSVTGTIKLLSIIYVPFDLAIAGPGASSLIVSGGNKTRDFVIQAGTTVSISGITITGGYLKQAVNGQAGGGGISNLGILTLNNVVVKSNKVYAAVGGAAVKGGGIYNQSGAQLNISNSTITMNTASDVINTNATGAQGGGIFNEGGLTVNDSTISANKATNSGAGVEGEGGSTNSFTNVVFSGNVLTSSFLAGQSGDGGAIMMLTSATLSLNGVWIDKNTATGSGGGVFASNNASVDITDSSITNNKASHGSGAGLWVSTGATANITNVTFSGNTAAGAGGGGLSEDGATVNLNNSTISNNNGATGAGGLELVFGTVNFKNTLVANNTAGGSGPDCDNAGGTLNSQGHNLIRNTSSCNITGTLTGNITGVDPLLGPLAHNGSSTWSRALLNASPALDAGDNATCAPTDQREFSRPQKSRNLGPSTCDIGSIEDTQGSTTTASFTSVASNDGWVLEGLDLSGNPTGLGGTRSNNSATINVGDDVGNNQYVGILSFPTKTLPDSVVIWAATLQLRQWLQSGSIGSLGNMLADIKLPFFDGSLGLSTSDFQAAPTVSAVADFGTPGGGFNSASLSPQGLAAVGLTQTTQFKLRFASATNGNATLDIFEFLAGENSTLALKPTLTVQYYVP